MRNGTYALAALAAIACLVANPAVSALQAGTAYAVLPGNTSDQQNLKTVFGFAPGADTTKDASQVFAVMPAPEFLGTVSSISGAYNPVLGGWEITISCGTVAGHAADPLYSCVGTIEPRVI